MPHFRIALTGLTDQFPTKYLPTTRLLASLEQMQWLPNPQIASRGTSYLTLTSVCFRAGCYMWDDLVTSNLNTLIPDNSVYKCFSQLEIRTTGPISFWVYTILDRMSNFILYTVYLVHYVWVIPLSSLVRTWYVHLNRQQIRASYRIADSLVDQSDWTPNSRIVDRYILLDIQVKTFFF